MTSKHTPFLGGLLLSCALVVPAFADAKGAPAPAPPPAKTAAPKLTVTPAANLKWQPLDPKSPMGLQVSSVHGDMFKGPSSFFLKLPAGAKSGLHAHTNDYYAVVISGAPAHGATEKDATTPMAVGSTWYQPGKMMHFDACTGDKECVLLLMYPGGNFDYLPGPAAAPAKPPAKKPTK